MRLTIYQVCRLHKSPGILTDVSNTGSLLLNISDPSEIWNTVYFRLESPSITELVYLTKLLPGAKNIAWSDSSKGRLTIGASARALI